MSKFSIEQQQYFLNLMSTLRQRLDKLKTKTTLQEFERLENQWALDELEQCFLDPNPENIDKKLTEYLAQRWERIRSTSLCYTQKPDNHVNQLCLELAKIIAPPITTEAEIKALKPNTGPYFLLMPSLMKSEDIYGENIHCFSLNEFILSDQERVFIPIAQCLHQASISDEGILRHLVLLNEYNPELLSFDEVKRLREHSKQSNEFYKAIVDLNQRRVFGDEIGSKLRQLAIGLRGGGARGAGSELNAGAAANEGIVAFNEFWNTLSKNQQEAIYAETPRLREILDRLSNPTNYLLIMYCVELLANELDPIIERYNRIESIEILANKVLAKEKLLEEAIKNKTLQINSNTNPPKNMLHLIHQLSPAQQKKIFKHETHKNALMFALSFAPASLLEFELNDASKQKAASVKLNNKKETALIRAAKFGSTEAIKLLLSWQANLNSQDINYNTALHWAAANGHVETVRYLLEQGAEVQIRGHKDNTPLHHAIMNGNKAIIDLLLKHNAPINIRNNQGRNTLDIALIYHPELVKPLLMQAASLPAKEQAEYLRRTPDSCPNVLLYTASKTPNYCKDLLNHILKLDPGLISPMLKAKDAFGKTALCCAARNGHVEAVTSLLNQGALLEDKGHFGTALHYAVRWGRRDVVNLLLEKNANINATGYMGLNALELALRFHSELAEPLLMHLLKLPEEVQAQCLKRLSFPNVAIYIVEQKPHLINALVEHLSQSKPELVDSLFKSSNKKINNPLLIAARMGAKESIPKLLKLGFDINAQDSEHRTALHFAVRSGNVDTLKCLLEHGAQLEAKGPFDQTPLNSAVFLGKELLVDFLLEKNANMNARNKKGRNALDLALIYHPEFVPSLLIHLVKLPLNVQAECLLRVPGGPYPNVFAYAAVAMPNFVDMLLSTDELHAFTDLSLNEHLHQIALHHQKMIKKSKNNSDYKAAASTAGTLLKTCTEAIITFNKSNQDIDTKISSLKIAFKDAVETARPVLKNHRALGKTLRTCLQAVTTAVPSLAGHTATFFSRKTKSERLLDNLQKTMDKPGPPLGKS
jgi:ankyrin repeat protein